MDCTVFISLGSNVGDRRSQIRRALDLLEALNLTRVTAVSSLYRTEPVGFRDQEWFFNAAASLKSGLSPDELLRSCRRIEETLGKRVVLPKGPRTIDLDLLFIDDQIIDEPDLVIPHPEIPSRGFVLIPLSEIAPGFRHPILKKTVRELLAEHLALKESGQIVERLERFWEIPVTSS